MFDSIEPHLDKAREILKRVPLIDGHNDWPYVIRAYYGSHIEDGVCDESKSLVGHVDIRRLREGLSGGIFFSAYMECPKSTSDFPTETFLPTLLETMQQIDLIHRLINKYPDHFQLVSQAKDIQEIFHGGRIAALIGVEGLHQIANSPAVLRLYHKLGVRYVTLTHNENNLYADSATDESVHGGLSAAGKSMIREMNRIGMMVDLSHVSENAMHDTLAITRAPVIFSHSSCKSLCSHPRNVRDSVLHKLKENRGIIMITFVPEFVNADAEKANLFDVVDHIIAVGDMIGYDHLGLGSDFDGMMASVEGLDGVDRFPHLVAAMLARDIKESDIEKVLGLNLIRVLGEVEEAAREVSKSIRPLEEEVAPIINDEKMALLQKMYPDAEPPREKKGHQHA